MNLPKHFILFIIQFTQLKYCTVNRTGKLKQKAMELQTTEPMLDANSESTTAPSLEFQPTGKKLEKQQPLQEYSTETIGTPFLIKKESSKDGKAQSPSKKVTFRVEAQVHPEPENISHLVEPQAGSSSAPDLPQFLGHAESEVGLPLTPDEPQPAQEDTATAQKSLQNVCEELETMNKRIGVSVDKWHNVFQRVKYFYPRIYDKEEKISASPSRVAGIIVNINKSLPRLKKSLGYQRKMFQQRKFQIVWYYQNLYEGIQKIHLDFERFKEAMLGVTEEQFTREVEELSENLEETCRSMRGLLGSLANIMQHLAGLNIAEEHFQGIEDTEETTIRESHRRELIEESEGQVYSEPIEQIAQQEDIEWWHWKSITNCWWNFLNKKWVRYFMIPGMIISGSLILFIIFVLYQKGYYHPRMTFNLTSSRPGDKHSNDDDRAHLQLHTL